MNVKMINMNIDEMMAIKVNEQVEIIKQLKQYLGWAMDVVELSHYKCDINSDTECWDDGPVMEHELIREANKLL